MREREEQMKHTVASYGQYGQYDRLAGWHGRESINSWVLTWRTLPLRIRACRCPCSISGRTAGISVAYHLNPAQQPQQRLSRVRQQGDKMGAASHRGTMRILPMYSS